MDSATTLLPCARCRYELTGIYAVDGRATCPECGLSQDVAGECARCHYSLKGITIKDARATCPECGHINVTNGLVERQRGERFVHRRRWLIASPVLTFPLAMASIWISGATDSIPAGLLSLAAFLWCFVAPPIYALFAGAARRAAGQTLWPVIQVALLWWVTTLAMILLLFILVSVLAI